MDTTHAPIEQALVRLSDGRMMPQLGYGTGSVDPAWASGLVADAIRAGYKSIDTAAAYRNEVEVGEGIRASGVARQDLFITTKLRNADQGHDSTLQAFDKSFDGLDVGRLDLYLIHYPAPERDEFVDTWKAFVRLQAEDRVGSIGVSNFRADDLERIIDDTGVMPALNQIEVHPYFQQVELRAWMAENGITVGGFSPFGSGKVLIDPTVVRIAGKHRRSPAQIVLRWLLDQEIVVISRATDRSHLVDNLSVGGFSLDDEDMMALSALDDPAGRVWPDPATTN